MTKKRTRTKSTAKKRTSRTTVQKRTAKRPTKKRATRAVKQPKKVEGTHWEIVPFAIAVLVAIVVLLQSVQSAREYRSDYGSLTARPTVTHMAAGCDASRTDSLAIRAAERALGRAIGALENAQQQYTWNCADDPHSISCKDAKEFLRESNVLVHEKVQEVQMLRIEACL